MTTGDDNQNIAKGQALRGMVDPATDDMNREWSYETRPTVCIGVPLQPDWTHVTYDGALYSRQHAELCFFRGDPLRPLLARQKTLLDGWIPIVGYEWRDGDVACDIETFAAPLDGEDASNTVSFVRATMRNDGPTPATAVFVAAPPMLTAEERERGFEEQGA